MNSIYGPVSSWRLGRSLGIDPICREKKACSFDCIYCQLRGGKKTVEKKEFVSAEKLRKDLRSIREKDENAFVGRADIITFSGTGEPTLAKNLGKLAGFIKSRFGLPLAVLTNSSFLGKKKVAAALHEFDVVAAKLDAPNERLFSEINRPHEKIRFRELIEGMLEFRENFAGKFALQMMFMEENKGFAQEMAGLAKELKPDEVQLNTPLRPCAAAPLSRKEMQKIKETFSGLNNVVSVYESEKKEIKPIELAEVKKRRREK